jgi:hypothetical protein
MIRQSNFAGSFYPKNKMQLGSDIEKYLKLAEEKLGKVKIPKADAKDTEKAGKQLKALIVPHAGYEYSGEIAGMGYKLLEGKNIENIIVIGPSHQESFEGIAFEDFEEWDTPLGRIKIDNSSIDDVEGINENAFALTNEHCIEVQVPFIQTVAPNSTLTALFTGEINNYDDYPLTYYIEKLKGICENRLLIVSTDLSHYQPYDISVDLDGHTIKEVLQYESIFPEQACGANGVNIISGIAKELGWTPVLLDYRNSGDTKKDKDSVVGYCAIAYYA